MEVMQTDKKLLINNFLTSTIVEASKVFQQHKAAIRQKAGIGNWVTEADLRIENYIIQKIHCAFPDHSILSEETASLLPTHIPNDLWLCDPLDGTTNATFGIPFSCISLAYMHEGKLLSAAIYDIYRKKLYCAEYGKGAYVKNYVIDRITRLKVREGGLQNGLVCTGSPYERPDFKPNWLLMDKVHRAGARLVMLGSASLEIAFVSEGKLSLFYEKGLKPWDIAAATLIVTEAGGIATCLEGDFNLFQPQTFICGNKKIINEFYNLFKEE